MFLHLPFLIQKVLHNSKEDVEDNHFTVLTDFLRKRDFLFVKF